MTLSKIARILAIASVAVFACRSIDGSPADTGRGDPAQAQWSTYGGTYSEQRFSALDEINTGNAGKLGLAWSFEFDTARGQEATPLMIDGVIYTSTAWSKVYALDATTGKELWHYDPQVPGGSAFSACCDVVNRGVAYEGGRIFLGTIDGRLQALDARTGRLIWSTQTVDSSRPYTISGAPRVAHGKVFIGNGGADFGVRGYVSAYDAATGRMLWRFYTVPGDPAHKDNAASDDVIDRLARPTWFGRQWIESGGGGTVWDSIVYDPETNRLYIGTGNGGPNNRKFRSDDKGDNLFLGSIVALDANTGRYIWHYQETPGDTWDYTSTSQIILADLPIGGATRKVILHAPKNGFFYVIDRSDGKLISAEKFAPINWADHVDIKTARPVENPDARYDGKPFLSTVGPLGGHSWQAMSFDPQTGLVYIPAMAVPVLFNAEKDFAYRPGRWNLGYDLMRTKLPEKEADRAAMGKIAKGWLAAWDPVHQREAWRVPHEGPWNGGVVSTAGGLIFQGSADGRFQAYDAKTGKALWSFKAPAGIIAPPISYRVGETQYIAIISGMGGAMPLAMPNFAGPSQPPNGRILVFKLGGTAKLPPSEVAAAPPIAPVDVPAPSVAIEKGRILFADNCAGCHGLGTYSSGIIPDLKRSGALGDKSAWQSIVIDGALQANGMASFAKYLSPADAETIRAYVAAQTRVVAATGPAAMTAAAAAPVR